MAEVDELFLNRQDVLDLIDEYGRASREEGADAVYDRNLGRDEDLRRRLRSAVEWLFFEVERRTRKTKIYEPDKKEINFRAAVERRDPYVENASPDMRAFVLLTKEEDPTGYQFHEFCPKGYRYETAAEYSKRTGVQLLTDRSDQPDFYPGSTQGEQ